MAASISHPNLEFTPQVRTRVVTADEHPLTLTGLRIVITEHPDIGVCAECSSWPELVRAAQKHVPDIIVLSEGLYTVGRAEQAELLSSVGPNCGVLLLSSRRDVQVYRDALCSGLRGIVLRDSPTAQIVRAIREVQKGGLWFERSLTERVVIELVSKKQPRTDPHEAKIASLTQREREVITLISDGLSNRKIAARLFVSEATVSHHLTSIFRKLEVNDRLMLVVYAFKKGLVPLQS